MSAEEAGALRVLGPGGVRNIFSPSFLGRSSAFGVSLECPTMTKVKGSNFYSGISDRGQRCSPAYLSSARGQRRALPDGRRSGKDSGWPLTRVPVLFRVYLNAHVLVDGTHGFSGVTLFLLSGSPCLGSSGLLRAREPLTRQDDV